MKTRTEVYSHLNVVLAAGALWGISEALLGMWLQRCAMLYSGAIMTGLAFLYLSFSWAVTRRLWPLVLLWVIVSLFKMLDAFLLSLPLRHGAVVNPLFAFFLETSAFVALVILFGSRAGGRRLYLAGIGGGAALASAMLFPVAGWITGVPVCLYPASAVPLSVATAPLAVLIAPVTVYLGFELAGLYTSALPAPGKNRSGLLIRYTWAPMVFILCLLAVTLSRL